MSRRAKTSDRWSGNRKTGRDCAPVGLDVIASINYVVSRSRRTCKSDRDV
jgi:hypothetical protein